MTTTFEFQFECRACGRRGHSRDDWLHISCPCGSVMTPVKTAPERAGREGDSQPMPTVNDAPDVQAAVIADIEARRELGIRRYGTALQPHNGRNALLDAYEEAIDLAMYLKQRLIEDGTA